MFPSRLAVSLIGLAVAGSLLLAGPGREIRLENHGMATAFTGL
jgi:hypothetical protein